jgi:hypothetical protein
MPAAKKSPSLAEPKDAQAPKLLEVKVSASLNGKVQVKKFDINSGYHFGLTETYDVSGMSQEAAEAFEDARLIELYDRVDPIAQAEFDKLWDQRLETGE